MKVKLHYNDFSKEINIDIKSKIGTIQENILNLCSLLIYNIEYSELIYRKEQNNIDFSIIMGSDNLPFDSTIQDFITMNKIKEENIKEITIYDRKRDEYGNVIKSNNIIDKYNLWLQNYNNELFINDNYRDYQLYNANNENRHIIRFPIISLLDTILNISNNENNIQYTENTQYVQNIEETEETEEIEEIEDNVAVICVVTDVVKQTGAIDPVLLRTQSDQSECAIF
jgi:hypothetical protein